MARWNRLAETVKTRNKREKTGGKRARYGPKSVDKEGTGGITFMKRSQSGRMLSALPLIITLREYTEMPPSARPMPATRTKTTHVSSELW